MKKSNEKKTGISGIAIAFLTSALVAVVLTVLLVFVFSYFVVSEFVPENMQSLLAFASCLIASAVSGYLTGKTLGRVLLTSLVQAVVNIAVFYLSGMAIFARVVPNGVSLYLILSIMVGTVLGGVFTAVFKPRRRKIK